MISSGLTAVNYIIMVILSVYMRQAGLSTSSPVSDNKLAKERWLIDESFNVSVYDDSSQS